jgi:hypothetical protein
MDRVTKNLNRLNALEKMIIDEPENDGALLCFICSVLDLIQDVDFLTQKGNLMIQLDITEDLMLVDKSPKSLTRASLYLTIAFVASNLFSGFVECMEMDKFKSILPEDFKSCIMSKVDRVKKLNEVADNFLKINLTKLPEKYAVVYWTEKMGCFTKDVFGSRDKLELKSEVDEIYKKGQEIKVNI